MSAHSPPHEKKPLTSIDVLKPTVTLTPPVAVVECDHEPDLAELQKTVTEIAGEYTLSK